MSSNNNHRANRKISTPLLTQRKFEELDDINSLLMSDGQGGAIEIKTEEQKTLALASLGAVSLDIFNLPLSTWALNCTGHDNS